MSDPKCGVFIGKTPNNYINYGETGQIYREGDDFWFYPHSLKPYSGFFVFRCEIYLNEPFDKKDKRDFVKRKTNGGLRIVSDKYLL